MIISLLVFLVLAGLGGGLVAGVWYMAARLGPKAARQQGSRWWFRWFIKGLGLPGLIWILMNIGLSWNLQPFMPQVQMARNRGGDWLAEFLEVAGVGLFILSSYWTAVTLAWVLFNTGRATAPEPRKDFKALGWTCFLGLIIPALLIVLLGGWTALGLAATAVLAPMAGYAPGLVNPRKLPPMYARAIARMKFGKYNEAEWEIIRELEKREDDFEGWMMLAELYATRFNDLAEAERTVLEITDQPTLTPSQLSIALHRLADWYLKLAGDPEAAHRALEMINSRLPNSHLAHMARMRIGQLPHTARELHEQQTRKPIPLPALGDSLDGSPLPEKSAADTLEAKQDANECVTSLQRDPDNIAAREKLARLLAESLNQADLGIEQLMLLLNLPEQPEGRKAEWLGLIAAWHIKYRHDANTGQSVLERLVNEFPQSPQAFAARRRLELMERKRRAGS